MKIFFKNTLIMLAILPIALMYVKSVQGAQDSMTTMTQKPPSSGGWLDEDKLLYYGDLAINNNMASKFTHHLIVCDFQTRYYPHLDQYIGIDPKTTREAPYQLVHYRLKGKVFTGWKTKYRRLGTYTSFDELVRICEYTKNFYGVKDDLLAIYASDLAPYFAGSLIPIVTSQGLHFPIL